MVSMVYFLDAEYSGYSKVWGIAITSPFQNIV
jgi:hypothetical protein